MRRHAKASAKTSATTASRADELLAQLRVLCGLSLVAFCAVAAVALGTADPASAAFTYGSPTPFNVDQAPEPLPVGVAVDNSSNPADPSAGDIYLATGNVINKYTPAEAAAGDSTPSGQITGFSYVYGVAVDPANGDVYATDYNVPDTVFKFDAEGNPLPFNTPGLTGQLTGPTSLAVNPNNGNVVVGNLTSSIVFELSSSGSIVTAYAGPSPSIGLAINSAGELFDAVTINGVVRFASPSSGYTQLTTNYGGGIAIDPLSQHVFVSGEKKVSEFAADGNQVGLSFGSAQLRESYGVGVPTGAAHVYVSDNPSNQAFDFQRLLVPDTTTGSASAIGATTATVSGHLDPLGGPQATCSFSYGTDPGLVGAESAPCTDPGPYSSPADVSMTLSGLNPDTTYYYRLEATTANGVGTGEIKNFATPTGPPVVTTEGANELGTSLATLHGTVNPGGAQTSYFFEYGMTEAYGDRLPGGGGYPAGEGNQDRPISIGLAGLQPGTTYHYRLVATNSFGTTQGSDRTFTTEAAESCPNAAIRLQQGARLLGECRAYERVSPAENGGVPVRASSLLGFRASPDGNQVVLSLAQAVYPNAKSNPLQPKVIATRTGDSWLAESLDIPTSTAAMNVPTLERTVFAVSKNMDRIVLVSSLSVGGQGVDGNANIYVYDRNTGIYTLAMTSPDPRIFEEIAGVSGREHWLGGSTELRSFGFWFYDGGLSPQAYTWSEADGLRSMGSGEGMLNSAIQRRKDGVSDDGSRIYYADAASNAVVLDENGSVRNLPGVPYSGFSFGAISPDGRYMMFTSTSPLTGDPTSAAGVYRYDAVSNEIEFLAEMPKAAGRFSGILEAWPERKEAYFRSSESIYRLSNGVVTLVAANVTEFSAGEPTQEYGASLDGRLFAFASPRKLTSYDNHSFKEIYLYDAQTQTLSCASCRSDGGVPSGYAQFSSGTALNGGALEFENYVSHNVTDDGTVYFDSPDPLVAKDVNGTRDVYAYRDGRLSLISPGDQPVDAEITEATPSGRDVFFTTTQRLVSTDTDAAADIYDARVDGGLASQNTVAIPPCHGDACRGVTPAAPEALNAATETLRGREGPSPRSSRKHCVKGQRRHTSRAHPQCARQQKPQGKGRQKKQNRKNHNRGQGR